MIKFKKSRSSGNYTGSPRSIFNTFSRANVNVSLETARFRKIYTVLQFDRQVLLTDILQLSIKNLNTLENKFHSNYFTVDFRHIQTLYFAPLLKCALISRWRFIK